jgi:MoaA/NifB/PqqE/SkfB family radical SAM enzyme
MRTISDRSFWVSLHRHARLRRVPLRVMFELTYKCNFHCRHCYVPGEWRAKNDLTTAGVCAIIGQLKNAGCFYLGFTGGEIFTRPDIYSILEFSRTQGMQTILYTNGSLIDKRAARHVAGIGVNKVDITLPGISPAVFEKVSGVRGAHAAVFAAIGYLRAYGVALAFKTCAVKANRGEIGAIQRFCAGLGCAHRLDGAASPLIPRLMRNQAKPTVAFRCGAGISQCAITPQGRVKLCSTVTWPGTRISRGNSFLRIWERLPEMIRSGQCRKACPCNLGVQGDPDE